MHLTVNEIKDIVKSKMIDHQQLRVVNICKHSQYQEGCKIRAQGCMHLINANWPNLQKFNLCK